MNELLFVIFIVSFLWVVICYIVYHIGFVFGEHAFSKALDREDDEDRHVNDMLNAIE